MSYFQTWIEKPRRVLLIMVLLCILALVLALSIPLGYIPRPAGKTIAITIEHKGIFEEEIEQTILDPLEAGLAGVSGITEISSVAERGRARLILTLAGRADLNAVFLEVREIVYAVYTRFPRSVQRPVIQKSDPHARPIFIAGFPISGFLGENELKRIFESVDGCGRVEIAGGVKPEVVIRFDPQKMTVAKLGTDTLSSAVRNMNILGGFTAAGETTGLIDSRFRSLDEMLDLMVSPGIRLRDVAIVFINSADTEYSGRVNGRQRLILYVQPEGDANTLALCTRLERLLTTLPQAEILYSYGRLVRQALVQILYAAGISIACVVLLTFLVMGRMIPALLISVNIPFSIIMSLALLRVAGEELNILSLSGIVVGVGLVIDAGVIFIDEFFRTDGSCTKTIVRSRSPILYSAATTVAVFMPLFFAPSMFVDQLKGLALSITGAVAASCAFVFCFLPAFLYHIYGSNRKLSPPMHESKQKRFRYIVKTLISAMNRLRWISAIVLVAAASVTVYLAAGLDIRNVDFSGVNWDLLRFSIEYPDGYTKEYILESAEPIEDLLLSCDGVEQVSSRYERERVSFFVQFYDAATRKEAIRRLMKEEETLGDAFLHFPEATAETSSFSLSIAGTRPQELQAIARQLAGELQKLPYCRGVLLHFKKNLPAKQLRVDLQKAAQAGIAPGVLRSQIYWALSSPVMDKWTTGREEMDIRLQTGDLGIEERNLSALLHLPCGELPLGMLVQLGEKSRTGRIYHMDRSRSVSLSVLSDQEHRRELISASRKILAGFSFPSGYRGEIGKEVEKQHFLSRALFLSLFLAVLLIFFILMFQFESLRISGLVILQIPGAFICPLLLLKLLSWPLSLPVVIGLILTSGIAVNNGILIFVELRHSKRMTVHEVLEALGAKLKPLLLSSATTIVGIAPLMLSGRVNRGILAPLSITVAAGIAGSICILIVTLSIFAAKE